MRFVNFRYNNHDSFGIVTTKGIIDLQKASMKWKNYFPQSLYETFGYNISEFDDLLAKETEYIPETDIEYLPAVLNPEKILCIGFNYLDHTKETSTKIPSEPIVFSKFNNALAANKESIKISKFMSKVDYEAELVVVMGKTCQDVKRDDALSYVFGYCCGNDISERKLQFQTSQWLIGKSPNQFAPIGPYVVTKDEVNPLDLEITCKVNGTTVQHASTKDMIFDVLTLISYVSRFITLKPGDVIFTGTPAGVILGRSEAEQKWLQPGDQVEIMIEGLGTLINHFI